MDGGLSKLTPRGSSNSPGPSTPGRPPPSSSQPQQQQRAGAPHHVSLGVGMHSSSGSSSPAAAHSPTRQPSHHSARTSWSTRRMVAASLTCFAIGFLLSNLLSIGPAPAMWGSGGGSSRSHPGEGAGGETGEGDTEGLAAAAAAAAAAAGTRSSASYAAFLVDGSGGSPGGWRGWLSEKLGIGAAGYYRALWQHGYGGGAPLRRHVAALHAAVAGEALQRSLGERADQIAAAASVNADGVRHGLLSAGHACPLPYPRPRLADIAAGKAKPYLFGGERPGAPPRNDTLWGNFCSFRSHGPVCGEERARALLEGYARRTSGSSGGGGGSTSGGGGGGGGEAALEAMLTLTPCDFWPFIHGRTLWVIGDVQMLDFYKQLKCLFYDMWTSEEDPSPTRDPDLSAVLSKYLTPSCTPLPSSLPNPTRICYLRADHGPYATRVLLPLLHQIPGYSSNDVVVASWGVAAGGIREYRDELRQFLTYVTTMDAHMPHIMWLQQPAQHEPAPSRNRDDDGDTSNNSNGGDGEGNSCAPLLGITLGEEGGDLVAPLVEPLPPWPEGKPKRKRRKSLERRRQQQVDAIELAVAGGWRNAVADDLAVGEAGLPVLPAYNESVPLHGYHREEGGAGRVSCQLYCLPSVHTHSVASLLRALRGEFWQPPPLPRPAGDGGDDAGTGDGDGGNVGDDGSSDVGGWISEPKDDWSEEDAVGDYGRR